MTDPNQQDRAERLDRYVRGELTPAEARELAQESLEDPGLFEELTYSALANKAIAAGPAAGRIAKFPSRRTLIITGSIAAMVALASVYAIRYPGRRPGLHATLQASSGGKQPILLADYLSNAPAAQPDAFRGAETQSRPPRVSGTVVSIDNGAATIDLGSADGLSNGMALDVYDEGGAPSPEGSVVLAAVFRDRARGSIKGRVRLHDRVQIAPAIHLSARMEAVRALADGGNVGAARTAAEDAARWAVSVHLPPHVLAPAWNTLAALRILQGDRTEGEALLRQALSACSRTDPSYPGIVNNLGVLAELAGDERRAEEQYRNARQALAGQTGELQTQQKVVESNLARVAR